MIPLAAVLLAMFAADTLAPDTLRRPGPPAHLALSAASVDETHNDRWLSMDKFWHLSASFVTVGASHHLCANRFGMSGRASTGAAMGGTAALGLTKEFYDLAGYSRHFSWKDLAADAAGIALGYFVFIHEY